MGQKHNDECDLALLFVHKDLTVSEIIDLFAQKSRVQLKQHLSELPMQWQQIIISSYPTFMELLTMNCFF